MTWEVLEGDCLELLRAMPDRSVQCCVTSPPYWGLRDYGHDGQLGLESTPDEFVKNLVAVFREVRRVLRDDGTLWLNLGDSYANPGHYKGNPGNVGNIGRPQVADVEADKAYRKTSDAAFAAAGLKNKDLCGVPWLTAFALRADGWFLRSEIIWAKPNPMPESVTDRPTKAHEQVFLLSKNARYFYDADAVREGLSDPGRQSDSYPNTADHQPNSGVLRVPGGYKRPASGMRNKRTVWSIATQPFAGAHFATFPPKLIEPMILAGSPPKCCGVCSAPWQRVSESEPPKPGIERGKHPSAHRANVHSPQQSANGGLGTRARTTTGWVPTCEHNDDTGSSVVLDPFSGSGTTGMVALRHDRSYIGLELNPEYAAMSRNRIRDDAPLLNTGLEVAA